MHYDLEELHALPNFSLGDFGRAKDCDDKAVPTDEIEDEIRRIEKHIAEDMDLLTFVAHVMMAEPQSLRSRYFDEYSATRVTTETDASDGDTDSCSFDSQTTREIFDIQQLNYSEALCSIVRSLLTR